jgi:hypothetical protein
MKQPVLELQPPTACALVHTSLQVRQWSFVNFAVSQPLPSLPSQFRKFVPQLATVQVPLAHDGVAFASVQDAPQTPQLVGVLRSASQPLVGLPSQSPKVSLPAPSFEQTGLHSHGPDVGPVHEVEPWALPHASPQLAQLAGWPSCTSQPSVSTVLQLL